MREVLKIIARRSDVRGLLGTDELSVEGWLEVMLAQVAAAAAADQRRLLAEGLTERKRAAEELHHELARVGAAAAEALAQLERDEGVKARPDEIERALRELPISDESRDRFREAIGMAPESWSDGDGRQAPDRRDGDRERSSQ